MADDTFTATVDTTNTPSTATWSPLDSIDGGAGAGDSFTINAITDFAVPGGATVARIENITIKVAANVGAYALNTAGAVDLSTTFAGATSLTISGTPLDVDFKAPETAAVTASGITGNAQIIGGTSQTVTLAAQGGAVIDKAR